MSCIYSPLKFIVRLGLKLYYRNIIIYNADSIAKDKPVLLLCNHPNSFMDAILIAAFANRQMYFLARGDAFNNKILARVFYLLNMLPIYRLSEGKNNLEKNTETFDAVNNMLSKKQVILIFSEGLSENNWDLRNLKKGPPRIALRAWTSNQQDQNTVVLPVGITYQHYQGANKSAILNYGNYLNKEEFTYQANMSSYVTDFNNKIAKQFDKLAYINPTLHENTIQHNSFMAKWQQSEAKNMDVLAQLKTTNWVNKNAAFKQPLNAKYFLLIWLWPHYKFMQFITAKATNGNVFYDSILFGLTLLLSPLYVLSLILIVFYII